MSGLAKLIKWLCAIVLSLIAIVYISYRIYWDFIEPVDTSTVYEYTVSLSVSTTGIAVRDENPLEDALTGIEYYPLRDGSRVALGETVAELRRGGGLYSDGRRQELEREIALLEEAQATAVDYTNTQVFNRDIKQELGDLSSMASAGRYDQLSEVRQNLTVNYNKKMIAGGKAIDYSDRLSQLAGELLEIDRNRTAETAATITAPQAGYFSSVVDGMESLIKPAELADLTAEEVLSLMEQGNTYGASVAGKMVRSEHWTFAAAVSSQQMEWISELMLDASKKRTSLQVEIAFEQHDRMVPAKVSGSIQSKDSDRAILLLECNWMDEGLINLRVEDVEIHFQEYTGLRINTSDLRFRTNREGAQERGVYVLRNNKVYFRLVDPIYEESGFLLSKPYYSAQEYLEPQRQRLQEDHPEEPDLEPLDPALDEEGAADEDELEPEDTFKYYVIMFDQVITKGNDLYHEKVLKDY